MGSPIKKTSTEWYVRYRSQDNARISGYIVIIYIEFGDSIQVLPLSIRDFTLDFAYASPEDENYPPAASTAEGNTDPLSSRLREFSQQLIVTAGN